MKIDSPEKSSAPAAPSIHCGSGFRYVRQSGTGLDIGSSDKSSGTNIASHKKATSHKPPITIMKYSRKEYFDKVLFLVSEQNYPQFLIHIQGFRSHSQDRRCRPLWGMIQTLCIPLLQDHMYSNGTQ